MVGMGRKGTGGKRRQNRREKEEKDRDTAGHSELCCYQRSSSSIQETCCHWSSLCHIPSEHLGAELWHRRLLQKAAVLSPNHSSMSRWT